MIPSLHDRLHEYVLPDGTTPFFDAMDRHPGWLERLVPIPALDSMSPTNNMDYLVATDPVWLPLLSHAEDGSSTILARGYDQSRDRKQPTLFTLDAEGRMHSASVEGLYTDAFLERIPGRTRALEILREFTSVRDFADDMRFATEFRLTRYEIVQEGLVSNLRRKDMFVLSNSFFLKAASLRKVGQKFKIVATLETTIEPTML